jgi:hypothetical protein
MCLVEIGQLLERVVANDIAVKDEERGIILAEDFLCEFKGTSGAEWFSLDGELDADVVFFLKLHETASNDQQWELLDGRCTTDLLKLLGHNLWTIVDGENDIGNASSSKGLDLMLNHRLVREFDERLR